MEVREKSPELKTVPLRIPGLIQNHLTVYLCYLVGAVGFTWPLMPNLSGKVISAVGGDVWQHMWHIWWARYSIFEQFSNPYYTYKLYHPTGVNLFFQTLNLPTGIMSTPLQYLFGLTAAFNLAILLGVALAGYTAYLLGRYVTGSAVAGLVAGTVYTFSPLESTNINQGQLEQITIGWFPLFILFFLKVMRRDPRPRLNLVIAALLLVLVSLVTWYQALFAWGFCGLYLLYNLVIDKSWRERGKTLGWFVAMFGLYALLISPILIPTVLSTRDGLNAPEQTLLTVAYNSSALKGFVGPGPGWNVFGAGSGFKENYLGYVALALGIFGLVGNFRKYWFWAVVIGFFIILSLGPALQVSYNPNLTQTDFDQSLPLPARLLYSLPIVNISRVPVRFLLVVMLALGILAGLGVARLQTWLSKVGRGNPAPTYIKFGVPVLAIGLILLEFFPFGRTLESTSVPAFYNQLDKNGGYAILEMPDKSVSRGMYYQTIHQVPLIAGYTSRPVAYKLDDVPGIRQLRFLRLPAYQYDIIDLNTLANTPYVLRYYNIRYLILHESALKTEPINRVLRATIGTDQACFVDQPGDTQVYCPPINLENKITATQMLLSLGDGWLDRKVISQTEIQRTTTGNDSQLVIFNPAKEAISVEISAPVQSVEQAANLQLWLDNKFVSETKTTTQMQPVRFTLTVQSGLNVLSFRPASGKNQQFTFGLIKIES